MIESRRQIGHWRRIGPPSASAHSASRLFCSAERQINRIVPTGALLRADSAKIVVRRWSPHLRKKSDWKRISLPDWARSFTLVGRLIAESTPEPLRRAGADRLPGEEDPDQGRGSGRAD